MKKIKCALCGSKKVIKIGFHENGHQRYYCKKCQKSYTEGSRTLNHIYNKCHKCGSINLKKNGFTSLGIQKLKCKDCGHSFKDIPLITCIKCNGFTVLAGFYKNKQRHLCKECGHKFTLK